MQEVYDFLDAKKNSDPGCFYLVLILVPFLFKSQYFKGAVPGSESTRF